jgi:hypothetical protein
MKKRLFASAVASIALTAASSAAPVITTEFFNNGTNNLPNIPFQASATDLLNGLTPLAEGTFNHEGTGGFPVLTDGVSPETLSRQVENPTGFQYSLFATGGTGATSGGLRLTYTLAEATSIASITVLGGWQDQGRDEQSYSILYALDTAPNTFLPLATVDFNPPGNANPIATRVTITDAIPGGILAPNVKALRFEFDATENGYSGYS